MKQKIYQVDAFTDKVFHGNPAAVCPLAHTTLTPYWASQLGKTELTAVQLSKRLGYLKCKLSGERVEISGRCRLYMIGEITI